MQALRKPVAFFRPLLPGIGLAAVLGGLALLAGPHVGGPILPALLLGLALFPLSRRAALAPGIDFASSYILRIGVALLGARITFDAAAGLGWQGVAILVLAVAATIGAGVLIARLLGMRAELGVLTGASVGICGAAAAMTVATVLPRTPQSAAQTAFTILAVNALSTLAMVGYPPLAEAVGLDALHTGLFLGGAIHDVAQVVGAGYAVSPEVGDNSVVSKLVRVTMLLPVVAVIAMVFASAEGAGPRPPWRELRRRALPNFLLVFVALAAVNSFQILPEGLRYALERLSLPCLVVAIAALGLKTSLGFLLQAGRRSLVLIVVETIFIAALVLGLVLLLHT